MDDQAAVDFTAELLEQAEADALAEIRAALSRGFQPPPRQTVSEWAAARRILTRRESAEPGPWDNGRTPYLVAIMDDLSLESDVERVIFMKGAQIGGSEVGNNWLGYIMSHPPAAAPAMAVLPTVELARRMSRQRLEPLIAGVPAIRESVAPKRSKDGGNTLLAKEFADGDGLLVLAGANSAAGLRSMSARWLYPDEVDAYPPDVEGEGDPIELLEARASTFGRRGKTYIPSTPTIAGESAIEEMFLETDQRRYFVPCPHCGDLDWIRWDRIWWHKEKTRKGKKHDPARNGLICEKCGAITPENRKPWLLSPDNGAEWRPTAEAPPGVHGYHLSALYSPLGWKSWERCIRQFLKADRDRGRTDRMKTWVNTVLGETWEEKGTGVDPDVLLARRENYPADIPAGGLVLVASVDVQDNRLEVLVKAWGRGEESWNVTHAVLFGDPEGLQVWDQLDAYLARTWEHELEGVELGIAAAVVDSSAFTQAVYRYVHPRQDRRIWAVKGRAGEGLPVTAMPTRKRLGPTVEGWVDLFTLGVDTAKGMIYSRLQLEGPGPGAIHYPVRPEFDEEWFAQVCAEKRRTHYHLGRPVRRWIKTRSRNEGLDLEVMNLAGLYILNPVWEDLEQVIRPQEDASDEGPPPAPRRRRRNWVKDW